MKAGDELVFGGKGSVFGLSLNHSRILAARSWPVDRTLGPSQFHPIWKRPLSSSPSETVLQADRVQRLA